MTTRPLSALAFQDHVGRLEDELEAALGALPLGLGSDMFDTAALATLRDHVREAHQLSRMLRENSHALSIEPDLSYE